VGQISSAGQAMVAEERGTSAEDSSVPASVCIDVGNQNQECYSGRSAYLNKCYVFVPVAGGGASKKCRYCHQIFSQKHANPTKDAVHIVKCRRAPLDAKADVAQHCHSEVVQDAWSKVVAHGLDTGDAGIDLGQGQEHPALKR